MKDFDNSIKKENYQIIKLFLFFVNVNYIIDNEEKKIMILELLIIMLSLTGAIASLAGILIDAYHLNGFNWQAFAGLIFFTLLFCFLIKPVREKTPEQIKATWKYKDYQAVYDYLDKHKPNLSYDQEDRESLAILLFFDWVIEDDSNPDALVLTRVTTSSNDTQIFQPRNKKSL